MPPDLLQVLLDLRFDRRRQYRPRRRRAGQGARRRPAARDRLPGLPRERPHHLSRPPVRGRRAAQRIGHGAPPAHADDGREPGARAASSNTVQGRAGAPRHHRARRAGGARRVRGAACRRRALRDHRRAVRRGPARGGRGLCRPRAGHGRLGHRARPARQLPPRRPAARARQRAALPRVDGQAVVLAGSASRATNAQVAEWRDTQGRPAFRIDPLAAARASQWPPRRSPSPNSICPCPC